MVTVTPKTNAGQQDENHPLHVLATCRVSACDIEYRARRVELQL